MFFKILLNAIILIPHVVYCANLLILSPTPCFSHEIAFREVWKELENRGHNITIVSPFPEMHASSNYTVIDSSATANMSEEPLLQVAADSSKWTMRYVLDKWSRDLMELVLALPEVQDLIHSHIQYKFDAVISEIWYPEAFTFSKLFNCPLIVYATIDVYEVFHWHLGNEINHVTLPDMNGGLFQASSFLERLNSFLFTAEQFRHHYFFLLPESDAVIKKYFGDNIGVTAKGLYDYMDLLLVNANVLLRSVRAIGATTVMVGGGNHLLPPKELPQDLKSYLDNATEGCIYLSLGTIIQSSNVDANLLDVMVDVLSKLPYKVLWKIEDEYLQRKPDNVKTIKWGPQQDILRHPNIKLFISQGGIQSLEEALFCHVPNLIMSFFGDQHKNGQLVTAKGIGKMIQHKPRLDKLELQSTILELINNPKYKATAKRLSTLMNDTYMTGLEKSVWWIEYVIRNNGTKELRNPAAKLPFWQYYALDVIGFILFSLAVSIWLLVFIAKSILGIFTADEVMESKKKR